MTLRGLVSVMTRRKWIIIAPVLICAVTAVVMSILQTPIYSSSSQVLVQPRGQDGLFDERFTVLNDRAIQTEIQVIEGDAVRDRVQTDLELGDRPPEATANAVGETDVISIVVRDPNPQNAQVYANAYAAAYIDVRREQAVEQLLTASAEVQQAIDDLQAQIDSLPEEDSRRAALVAQLGNFNTTLDQLRVDAALRTGGAAIIRPAELPTDPVEPTPARTVALAGVVGLLIGLGAAFLLDYLDDKVRSEGDLEHLTDRPVLAVVPVDPPPDNRPLAASEPSHSAVEAYRGLRTTLEFLGLDQTIKVLQLTSSIAGEGKTTTATNLAVVLAQAGHRVALVDADLRRPRVHEVFALPQGPGFTELALGMDAEHVAKSVHLSGAQPITVFTSGSVPSNPSEVLSGRRVRQLLEELGVHYDYVLVDSAPVLPVSDSVALSGAVDAVLLVAQAGRVTDEYVTDAIARLDRVGATTLGLVLNRADSTTKGYYAYGGYGTAPPSPSAAPSRVPDPDDDRSDDTKQLWSAP